jgi:hypothetical protein
MFHLRDTLPHPSSSPPGDPSQPTQGKARPTIVLLLPYSKQDLPVSGIPRHHKSTPCVSPTSPTFLCQPIFCGVLLTSTSGAMVLFSRGVNALLIKLVGHWHSEVMLHYLHVQSHPIMSGLSKLMLPGGNPQLLAETATMPLPNPSLFVG